MKNTLIAGYEKRFNALCEESLRADKALLFTKWECGMTAKEELRAVIGDLERLAGIELRYNPYHDEYGRFASADGTAKRYSNGGAKPVDKSEESDIIIPKGKLVNYALDTVKQPDKSLAFQEALGYTADNCQKLIDDIYANADISKMKYKGNNGFGDLYEQVMNLEGLNGKKANVCTGWINKPQKAEYQLTSCYITKKKGGS